MKRTKNYESPRLVRVTPLFLEQGVCNNSIIKGDSGAYTNAPQVEDLDYSTINHIWN